MKDDREVMYDIINRCLSRDMFANACLVSYLRPVKKVNKKRKIARRRG
jgi:hypothetical protein